MLCILLPACPVAIRHNFSSCIQQVNLSAGLGYATCVLDIPDYYSKVRRMPHWAGSRCPRGCKGADPLNLYSFQRYEHSH